MAKYNDIQQQTIDERIESFLRGTMTEEEEANFKQEIKEDPEFRSHVRATVSLIKGLREKAADEEKTIIQNNTKDRARTLLWWACSIAAVFAIFFGYQKDKRFNELSDMVSPYYAEYNMSDYTRGDVDSVAHPKAIALGVVGSTELNIGNTTGGAPLITASAYGGSENGMTLGNTSINLRNGQIGVGHYKVGTTNCFDGPYSDAQWTAAIAAVNFSIRLIYYLSPILADVFFI